MKYYKVIPFIFMSGCVNQKTLFIENEFTTEEVDMIELAIDEWVKATDSLDAVLFTHYGLNDDGLLTIHELETPREYGMVWKITTADPAYQQYLVDNKVKQANGLGSKKCCNCYCSRSNFR